MVTHNAKTNAKTFFMSHSSLYCYHKTNGIDHMKLSVNHSRPYIGIQHSVDIDLPVPQIAGYGILNKHRKCASCRSGPARHMQFALCRRIEIHNRTSTSIPIYTKL